MATYTYTVILEPDVDGGLRRFLSLAAWGCNRR